MRHLFLDVILKNNKSYLKTFIKVIIIQRSNDFVQCIVFEEFECPFDIFLLSYSECMTTEINSSQR